MNSKSILLAAGFIMAALVINAQTKNTMEKVTFTPAQKKVMQVILDMTEAFHKKDILNFYSEIDFLKRTVIFTTKTLL